jgi:ATP-binding cassette subfamily B (MDR/TAP) protein 1
MRAQYIKANHQRSAQVASEAVASLRTIIGLTAEEHRIKAYSESLEAPLRQSNRTTPITGLIFALSVSMQYPINALVFWYGSQVLSRGEASPFAFLACFFVSR